MWSVKSLSFMIEEKISSTGKGLWKRKTVAKELKIRPFSPFFHGLQGKHPRRGWRQALGLLKRQVTSPTHYTKQALQPTSWLAASDSPILCSLAPTHWSWHRLCQKEKWVGRKE